MAGQLHAMPMDGGHLIQSVGDLHGDIIAPACGECGPQMGAVESPGRCLHIRQYLAHALLGGEPVGDPIARALPLRQWWDGQRAWVTAIATGG